MTDAERNTNTETNNRTTAHIHTSDVSHGI